MREILFRGKKNNSGEWVYGNLFNPDKSDTPTQICMGTHIVRICYEIDPKTVGQYTGLTDKNSKKIFEGDIIKCKVHEMNGYRVRRGIVEYHGVGFIMNLEPNSWYDQKNIPLDCEVIGNIYDNLELLKGGVENG